jgi:hypothetical protein
MVLSLEVNGDVRLGVGRVGENEVADPLRAEISGLVGGRRDQRNVGRRLHAAVAGWRIGEVCIKIGIELVKIGERETAPLGAVCGPAPGLVEQRGAVAIDKPADV